MSITSYWQWLLYHILLTIAVTHDNDMSTCVHLTHHHFFSARRLWTCLWFWRTTRLRKMSTLMTSSQATCGTAKSSKIKRQRRKIHSGSNKTHPTHTHTTHTAFTSIKTQNTSCFILYIYRYFILYVNKRNHYRNVYYVSCDLLQLTYVSVHSVLQYYRDMTLIEREM